AESAELSRQGPSTLLLLGTLLCERADTHALGIRVLRHAQQLHPGNFWLNNALGVRLPRSKRSGLDEVMRFQSIAVALQPSNAGARLTLGLTLLKQEKLDEAIAEFRRTIQLKPDYAEAHRQLGFALHWQGKSAEAIAASRRAIQLQPNLARAHRNL